MNEIHGPPNDPSQGGSSLRDWHSLTSEEQTALLIAHGHDLDRLPHTCHVETKVARLQAWLRDRGIHYSR